METAGSVGGLGRFSIGKVAGVPAAVILAAALFVFGSVVGAQAAGLDVGEGCTFDLSTGSLHLGCGDLRVAGSAAIGSGLVDQAMNVMVTHTGVLSLVTGTVKFSGSWTVKGAFNPGSGTVAVVDECGTGPAAVNGDNTFCNLELVNAGGKRIDFEEGTTQTVACDFRAVGAEGSLEVLRSSRDGKAAYICLLPGATQEVKYVDVADVQVPDLESCQRLAPGAPIWIGSRDSGNTYGWFNNGIVEKVPTLGGVGAALMALLMLLLGWLAIRRKMPAA